MASGGNKSPAKVPPKLPAAIANASLEELQRLSFDTCVTSDGVSRQRLRHVAHAGMHKQHEQVDASKVEGWHQSCQTHIYPTGSRSCGLGTSGLRSCQPLLLPLRQQLDLQRSWLPSSSRLAYCELPSSFKVYSSLAAGCLAHWCMVARW
jgi:hypothetical protein